MDAINNSINEIRKTDQKINSFMFTNYRYNAELRDFILDSLTRYIHQYAKIRNKKNNVISLFIFESENDSDNEKEYIEKIIISSNHDDHVAKEILCQTLTIIFFPERKSTEQILFEKLFESDSRVQKLINEILEKIDESLFKISTLETLRSNLKSFFRMFDALNDLADTLNTAQNEEEKNLFLKVLELLQINFDVYLISRLNEIYEFKQQNVAFIQSCIQTIVIPNPSNLVFHSEAKLAIYLRLNTQELECIRHKYIAVSKLCCPLCARLLFALDFRFRGNHSSFTTSIRNWYLNNEIYKSSINTRNENQILLDYNIFLKELLDLFINHNDRILKKYFISKLFCFDFERDNEILNYCQMCENSSIDACNLRNKYSENLDDFGIDLNNFNIYSILIRKINSFFTEKFTNLLKNKFNLNGKLVDDVNYDDSKSITDILGNFQQVVNGNLNDGQIEELFFLFQENSNFGSFPIDLFEDFNIQNIIQNMINNINSNNIL